MTVHISTDRTESGKILDSVSVGPGGRLILNGVVERTLHVESGGYAHVRGVVSSLVVERGAVARLDGVCAGDAHNFGGELVIAGVVTGGLHGSMYTTIIPGSRILGIAS